MDDFIEYDISQACKEITKLCQMSMAELTVLGQDYSGIPICPFLKRFREITVLFEKHPGYVPADINELIDLQSALAILNLRGLNESLQKKGLPAGAMANHFMRRY